MEAAGYDVSTQEFVFQTFINPAPPVLEQVAPPTGAGPIVNNIMTYSGSGNVTANVTVVPAATDRVTPGCEATDFPVSTGGDHRPDQPWVLAPLPSRRPTPSTRGQSVSSSTTTRQVRSMGLLETGSPSNLPVTSVTQEVGLQLAGTAGLVLHLVTSTFRGQATTSNVFAEKTGKNADNVVIAGGHLDSVDAGPGINDNGSGSAALLEVAEQMAKVKPQNTLRFAWWGAEEASLVGSTYYVTNLSQAERDKIALYLNFDMVGSPNHVFFIYDGDNSDGVGAPAGPPGSAQIEKKFEEFFNSRGIPFKGTDFSGRSDYGPFIAAGVDIPSGGLFTGAEGHQNRRGGRHMGWHRRTSRTTPATTKHATPSTTSTCSRWTPTPTPSPMQP